MSEGIPVPLPHARKVANELRDMLLSVCERIEVAGSIRREKAEVKDGELVAIPRLGDGHNLLHARLEHLVEQGKIRKAMVTDKNGHTAPRWGADFRKVSYSGMNFDLFMTDEDSFGYLFWLRTGPDNEADKANTFIMTKLKYGKPSFRVEKGNVMFGDRRVPVRTENEFFALLGLPFIEPKDRRKLTYEAYFRKAHKWGDPRVLLPTPAPELRLLWNYTPETLAAYPVPLDFIDEGTGKMWANVTLDRRNGPFERVEKGSREAAFQREFLVGTVQQRVELERLRDLLWKDQLIDVPGVVPIHDKLRLKPLGEPCPTERIPLELVVPTQPQVYRLGVHHKSYMLRMFLEYPGSTWLEPSPGIAVRFEGDAKVYIFDGHHRYMAAREKQADMPFEIHDMPYTLAAFLDDEWVDNTDYAFLTEVLEEALSILAEGVAV